MKATKVIIGLILFSAFAAAQQTTIRVPLGGGEAVAEITFDQSRVSVTDAKRWIQLFPQEGTYNQAVGWSINCHSGPAPSEIGHLKSDKERNERLVKDLDPSHYPEELSQVAAYLRHLQSLWLWLGSQELDFLANGNGNALEATFDGVNPKHDCKEAIDKIALARNREEACELVHHDWNNCVNSIGQKRLGAYPEAVWQKFLDDNGIRVRALSTVDD